TRFSSRAPPADRFRRASGSASEERPPHHPRHVRRQYTIARCGALERRIDHDSGMTNALRDDLERQISGEVRFDRVSRALYATDASVYQIEPAGVVVPRTREDILAAVNVARAHGVSITARGGGTSHAGQAIGAGVVVDTSKYLNAVIEVNASERWAWVEPGIVLDELNARLRAANVRFAPDISTASRATVGGMIANNSSGARSVMYGKT